MNSIPVFVGLDYHQDSIQVCVLNQKGDVLCNRSVHNDSAELARVITPLGTVQRVGIEACCGSADLGQELVEKFGWNVSLGHPLYISSMRKSPDKSDFSDGRLLADLTRVGYLPAVWLPPAYIRDLRQLVNHRHRLVKQKTAAKLQIGAVLREQRVKICNELGGRWTKAWIAGVKNEHALSVHALWIVNDLMTEIEHLEKKVAAVEQQLRQATAEDDVVKKLLKQPGIGEVTAWVLRACIGRFDRFKNGRQLSRYCGLSPCNASSGTKTADTGLIDGCNKMLRATIVQAAHRLIRSEPRWNKLAESLIKRDKAKCVAVAAVANRWMRCLHHVMNQTSVPVAPESVATESVATKSVGVKQTKKKLR